MAEAESVAIIGPVGAGKTMLVNVISQFIWESVFDPGSLRQTGHCKILGRDVTPRKPNLPTLEFLNSQIAVIGERTAWLPISVAENFLISQKLAGVRECKIFFELLEDFPLSPRNRAQVESLSELLPSQVEPPLLQLLAIMRAIMRKPNLLILDEPFLRMDNVLLRQTENIVLTCADQATILWATNDLHQASRVTDSILLLMDGTIKECTPTAQFFTNPRTREAENFIAGKSEDI